jgi:hypothetical protein
MDDGSEVYSRSTDSLQAIADGGSGLTAADVWNYDIPSNYAPTGTSAGAVLDKLTEEAATLSTDVDLGSVFGQLMDNGGAWTYSAADDSLEALQADHVALPSQSDITGGAYALDTDANGRLRIVDGTGVGEINTLNGYVDASGSTNVGLSSSAIDLIWDDALSGHTTSDTPGNVLNMLTQDSVTLSTDVAITSIVGQLMNKTGAWAYDNTTDSLEAIADGGSGLTAADVWGYDIPSNFAPTDTTAGGVLDKLTEENATISTAIAAGSVIDQMLDNGTAQFDRTTDSLQAIADGGSGLTAADVWDYDIPSNYAPSGTSAGSVLDKLTEETTTLSSDVALGSVVGQLMDDGTAWSYSAASHSLEAIRIRGDAAWTTGGGTGLSYLAAGTAQAGAASTITLAAGEDNTADLFNGTRIGIHTGTGAGQCRLITDYDTGRIATVDRAWITNPDATSQYEIIGADGSVAAVLGDSQSATDLKDFVDAGYDPSTDKVQGLVLADTVTTLTGHTAQTGDSYGIVNDGTYGNAQLIRATTPANTLDTTAAGLVDVGLIEGGDASDAINAEIVDALTVDTVTQPGQGAPPAAATIDEMLSYLYMAWRNRATQTAGPGALMSIYDDAGTTVLIKATTDDDGSTFTRGKMGSGP